MSRLAIVGLLLFALLVAACDGGSGSSDSAAPTDESSAPPSGEAAERREGGAPGGGDDPAPAAGAARETFEVSIKGDFSYIPENPTKCNADHVLFQFDLLLSVYADDTIDGSTEGVANWFPISRCPATYFGGIRTAEPPLLTISGFVDSEGWNLIFDSVDLTEWYFVPGGAAALGVEDATGEVYSSGNHFDSRLGDTYGRNVEGTLRAFVIPADRMKPGEVFRFDMQVSLVGMQGSGPVVLELCAPAGGDFEGMPFFGCRAVPD